MVVWGADSSLVPALLPACAAAVSRAAAGGGWAPDRARPCSCRPRENHGPLGGSPSLPHQGPLNS